VVMDLEEILMATRGREKKGQTKGKKNGTQKKKPEDEEKSKLFWDGRRGRRRPGPNSRPRKKNSKGKRPRSKRESRWPRGQNLVRATSAIKKKPLQFLLLAKKI